MTFTERRLGAIQVRIASDGRRVFVTPPDFWRRQRPGLLVAAAVLPLLFWSRVMTAPLEAWTAFLADLLAEREPGP